VSVITPALARQGVRWLLQIRHQGQVYRWTSDGLPVASRSGDLATTGGMDALEVRETLPVVGGVADRRSVSVTIQWPTDVAAEAAQGSDLTTGTGEIYLLAGPQQVEDARLVVAGPLSQPVYGGVGEPVRLTIAGEPYDDAAQIPEASARISLDTWPDATEAALGRWYPLVWGRPGVADDAGVIEGSPAYAVEHTGAAADRLLIAGHAVTATSVQVVYDAGGGTLATLSRPVEEVADGLGRTVATVDVSGASAALRAASAWTIRWVGSGGLTSPYQTGRTVSTLGEIARYLAEQSTIPQDRAAWAVVMERYPWSSSGWLSEPASPMDVLRDQILPVLPVAMGWSSSGMRPIRYRYDAGQLDHIDTLRAGEDCSRTGGVTYERQPEDIAQQIRVGYGGDSSRRWVVLEADGWRGGESTSSVWSRAARQRWRAGPTRTREVLSPAIWRRSTAALVALWQARVHGASPRTVMYSCGPERAWIDLGDVVRLTDLEIGETDTLALVIARTIQISGAVDLDLMILPGWDVRLRGEPAGASPDTPVYIGS